MNRGWRQLVGLVGIGMVCLLGIAPGQTWGATRFDLGLQGGYRQDRLDWNIAGSVDVLSELVWENLDIYQLQLTSALTGAAIFPGGRLTARGLLGAGRMVAGDNRDSDYAGDGRTLEFSRSSNDAGDGQVYDFSLGAGLEFSLPSGLRLTPLLGYSHHEQHLVLQDGVQTLSQPQLVPHSRFSPPPLGAISGLDSTYEARWYGPFVGFDLSYPITPAWLLTATAELHWGEMKAEADWNLRSDFAHPVSFRQRADAYGLVLAARAHYALAERWDLVLAADYTDWSTDPGLDQIYFADGGVSATRLNEVNWRSFALQAGLQYRFF